MMIHPFLPDKHPGALRERFFEPLDRPGLALERNERPTALVAGA
jgi:hypothetical protein